MELEYLPKNDREYPIRQSPVSCVFFRVKKAFNTGARCALFAPVRTFREDKREALYCVVLLLIAIQAGI